MEMRIFGRTGLRLSVLGFGCGAVGGCDGGGETPEGGGWAGRVPVVWAMTGVDATAITPAIAATRKLTIMAGSPG